MALFSPWGNQQFFDDNGDPAVGWKINTYIGGSNSPSATFTTAAGNVSQPNPIILDALGFPANGPIWLSVGSPYKFVLTDPNGVVRRTEDGITGVTSAATEISQWLPSGVTPTYVSATKFTAPGDQTTDFHIGRRAQFSVAAGTVYGQIISSVFSSGVTTISLAMEGAGVLDSGLSVVNLSILRNDHLALPGFSSLLAQSGYQKLPSGVIIQSGLGNCDTSGSSVVLFPISYTTGSPVVVATPLVASFGTYGVNITGRSAGGFSANGTLNNSGVNGLLFHWISFGY